MRCNVCNTELNGDEKVCPNCSSPVGEAEQTVSQSENQFPTEEPKKSGKKKGILIGAAAAVVVAGGALAFSLMSSKDPKEVVLDAFETIYTEDQVNPMEELFGWSQFVENAKTADVEASMTLVMDYCSEPDINEFAGSGIRITGKEDKANKKSSANVGVIFKDMDLFNVDAYYGDRILMMAFPEFSGRVFTLDLGEGLADRIENSPMLSSVLEYSDVDVHGLVDYMEELIEDAESGGKINSLDLEALRTRYKEGTKAQEKFKEALTVEKGEKDTFTVDGEEVTCQGYQVVVSKDSMIEFLRTSSDFFLNDQELKDLYLEQLERSVTLAELMGGTASGYSAADIYTKRMEDLSESVDEMIDFLDEKLTDVFMDVYVDKKGRLAAVKGTTVLDISEEGIRGTLDVAFDVQFQGGSYPTQNMTGELVLENDGVHITCTMDKKGTYDGKQLTGDLALNMVMDGSDGFDVGVVLTGTYNSDGGDYHIGLSAMSDNSLAADVSIAGVVDQLEKGESIHIDVDELKIAAMNQMVQVTLSGDYSYGPLAEPILALEGEEFDILAADENQWESVFMEFYMGIMQLANQIDM